MDKDLSFMRDSESRVLIGAVFVLIILIVLSMVVGLRVERKDNSVPTKVATSFSQVSIVAQAAYVYDLRSKTVLYANNENARLPLASLTKLMSALVAYELGYEHGVVVVTDEAIQAEGDSGLLNGERWSLKDLLDFSLVASSNDGMRALALSLGAVSKAGAPSQEIISDFVVAMNSKARELGLENTHFSNETGLDIRGEPVYRDEAPVVKAGAYGSVKDVNTLMEHIIINNPEIFSATGKVRVALYSLDNYPHLVSNTNSIASEIPGLIASKTGFTDTAGGNLSIIFDPELGRPFIITVLGSTEKGRFDDVEKLVQAVMDYVSYEN